MNNIPEKNHYFREDEIDLKEIFSALIKGKWFIFLIIALFSISGVFYSLSLPNIYQSKALLYPADQQSGGIGGAMKAYSGLAGLAGINIPSQASESNAQKAIQKVNSLSFFSDNLLPNIFLPDLMALDSWIKESNSLVYKEDIYDETIDTWIRDFQYPQKQIPSAQESYSVFRQHIQISEDEDSGFVIISIKHKSPFIAQEWTELVVNEINDYFRTKDKTEAEISATYLKEQIAKTNFTEIKKVVAELLQARTQQLSLIEVGEYYVFAYIDPPVVMEKKAEPARSIICVIFTLIGAIFGILIVIIRHYLNKTPSNNTNS